MDHESHTPKDPVRRVFVRNIGVLAIYMIPCMMISATTTMARATAFTYVALFAALVLPLFHGVGSVIAGGGARRRGRHELGATLTRSGWVIVTIWIVTWIVVLVLANR